MTRGLLLVALVACSAGEPGPGIDVDRALSHARALVELGPRPGESENAKRAAAYVVDELPGAQRSHVGTIDLPEIRVAGRLVRIAHRTITTDTNIVARYGPSTGKPLLFMAHYDTVRSSPGALDNAAAVGVLLELGRVLAATPPPMPVIIAITAREEDGLIGADALAAQLASELDFVVALDLIGGDADLVLNGAGMLIGDAEMSWLAAAADRAGVVLRAPLPHRVVSRWWPQAERSDHGPFTRRGVRAVHFYHRGHDGDVIDRAYHTPLDRFERIVPARVGEIGRLLHALTVEAPPPHAGDGFWLPIVTNVVVPRWTLVAFELACILGALLFVVRMRRERTRGGAGLFAGIAVTAIAFAAVAILERAAARPFAWIHAPGYFVIAHSLVLVGVLGLASRLVARFRPWIGARRYLVVAIAILVAFGIFWLAVGAAELAWVWLVPAIIASTAPFVGRAKPLALAPTLLPLLLVLAPSQLREAAWNGFLPPTVPLAAWLAMVALPPLAACTYMLRDRGHSGPLGTFVLSMGWALAIVIGGGMEFCYQPPCTASRFQELHLTCEMASGV
jgi:Peptidase family M28